MRRVSVLVGLAALFVSGCTYRTIREQVADPGPVVAPRPLPESERMKLGISEFKNESPYGAGLFVDETGDRLGQQVGSMLARHLSATQRFTIVERPEIEKVKKEAALTGRSEEDFRKNLLGVDALIFGAVVELGRDTIGRSWLLGGDKTQRARARVTLRLVDPKTTEVFYTQEGSGEATLTSSQTLGVGGAAAFDSTLEGKAIDAAIVSMMNNVIATLEARHPAAH